MSVPALFVTSYGRAAADVLRTRIAAAKADDPLQPVTVLVPTNYVGVSTRRLLATGALGPVTSRGNGIAGLTLLTVYRLAELLGAPALAGAGRRPVSTPLVGAAVRRVLHDAPGIFAPVATHPSTEEALVRAHRELSELPASSLETLERQGRRAADVVRIHRAVRRRLVGEWYEEVDLMASAARAVRSGSAVLDDLGTVVVYLPEDLSLPACQLLRAVADAARLEIVAGLTGVAAADQQVRRTLHRLGVEVPGDVDIPAPPVDEIVSVTDAEEEVRSAVARVVAAAREGVALERIAVLYPAPEPYARIVHEQFEAAGIAYNGAAVRPLADRVVGRWLLDLLDLPARDHSRPAVLGLLTSAPVVDGSGHRIPTAAWERVSREAGVIRGREEWRDKLRRHADDLRRQADAPPDGAPAWTADRARRRADEADALRQFVGRLFRDLDEAASLRRWDDIAAWCKQMIGRYIQRRREGWPAEEVAAADRVDAALDRLAGLEALEPRTDLVTFRRALQLELDDDLGRVGELGRGVLVGTPSSALGVDLDVVVVLGMAEGVSPTRPREDSLLPDAERRAVADVLAPRDQRVGVEHRHLLAALAAARRRRVMIQPRGDLRRSVERAPSRWLLDAVARREPGSARALPHRADWFDMVPSFAARVRRSEFPSTRQEYRLRALGDVRVGSPARDGLRLLSHAVVASDAALRRGVDMVLQRRAGDLGRFTGRLSPHATDLVARYVGERVASATAFETWLSCPHAFLLGHVLGVKPVENPEELLRIDALQLGSLVHDVLERWLGELLTSSVPAPEQPWPDAARDRLQEIARDRCRVAEERGVTGHPLLWRRDRRRILADFEQFVRCDDERRRADGLTPSGSELPFGMAADVEPLVIDLGDGRRVRMRGRIDRVDRARDGTVVIADYKTGRSDSYGELSQDAPLGDGTRLQLPIYGLAVAGAHPDATGVRAEYWFVSSRGGWKRIGYRMTDTVVAELRRALRTVVDGVEAGLFPMRPPAPVWRRWPACVYCEPDGLGTADQYREWERIRNDPALRGYLALVEPETVDAAGAAEGDGAGSATPRPAAQDTLW